MTIEPLITKNKKFVVKIISSQQDDNCGKCVFFNPDKYGMEYRCYNPAVDISCEHGHSYRLAIL